MRPRQESGVRSQESEASHQPSAVSRQELGSSIPTPPVFTTYSRRRRRARPMPLPLFLMRRTTNDQRPTTNDQRPTTSETRRQGDKETRRQAVARQRVVPFPASSLQPPASSS